MRESRVIWSGQGRLITAKCANCGHAIAVLNGHWMHYNGNFQVMCTWYKEIGYKYHPDGDNVIYDECTCTRPYPVKKSITGIEEATGYKEIIDYYNVPLLDRILNKAKIMDSTISHRTGVYSKNVRKRKLNILEKAFKKVHLIDSYKRNYARVAGSCEERTENPDAPTVAMDSLAELIRKKKCLTDQMFPW